MSLVTNSIFLPGERLSGSSVTTQNIQAAVGLADIVRTTLGPIGLDKMIIDQNADVVTTNDGATIMAMLDAEHPAAKVLVELSGLQDREVGDGTTSVVIIAAEFLRNSEELMKAKLHPTNIIQGYTHALKKATKFIENYLTISTDEIEEETLLNVARTSMSSKIISNQAELFARIIVDAMKAVKYVTAGGETKYPVRAINILKAFGQSSADSKLIDGFALNCVRATEAMPESVVGAKIALIDFNLQQERLAVGTQILIKDPKKLEEVKAREFDITKERIRLILESGANCIFTTGGIDDMAQKYLVEQGVLGIRRCDKDDLQRIARMTGGAILSTLADLEGEEKFDEEALGHAESVVEERVADSKLTFIRGTSERSCGSIVLRGPNSQMLDEVDRSVHDALCAVSKTLESGKMVAGGGAVESALSVYLERHAATLEGREQMAVKAFAKALLAIPRQLAINSALDATELVANLRNKHAMWQKKNPTEEELALRFTGLDLKKGEVRNNLAAGVVEPAMIKIKALSFAVEAATTILRIDENITLTPAQQQQQGR